MNQLQIAMELKGMLSHLRHYQRINVTSKDDLQAAGAEYAYGHACRRIDKLLTRIIAEGIEGVETDA